MKRDMEKTVEKFREGNSIPAAYDITLNEIEHLMTEAGKDIQSRHEALKTAFTYGFIMGSRANGNKRI